MSQTGRFHRYSRSNKRKSAHVDVDSVVFPCVQATVSRNGDYLVSNDAVETILLTSEAIAN